MLLTDGAAVLPVPMLFRIRMVFLRIILKIQDIFLLPVMAATKKERPKFITIMMKKLKTA